MKSSIQSFSSKTIRLIKVNIKTFCDECTFRFAKGFFFCVANRKGDISMEGVFEALLQLLVEIVFEIVGEIVGATIEYTVSSDFWDFLNRNLPAIVFFSDEIITLDILS